MAYLRLINRYRRWRKRWHDRKVRLKRRIRLLFPSPAEVRWARMMGAYVIIIPFVKTYWHRESRRFPMCFIIPAGWYKDNCIEREIWVRGYQIDFGNPWRRIGVEIDGRNYHDIVYDQEREEHLARSGWRLRRFRAAWVNPNSPEYRGAWVVEETGVWFL